MTRDQVLEFGPTGFGLAFQHWILPHLLGPLDDDGSASCIPARDPGETQRLTPSRRLGRREKGVANAQPVSKVVL